MLRLWALLLAFAGTAAAAQEPPALVQLRTVQQAGAIVKYDPAGAPSRPGLCMEVLRAVEQVDPRLSFTDLERQVPLKRVERLLAEGAVDAFFCLLKS
ncbi:MAG: hypothetical protein EOP35_25940, partial [Rubrivivax sp.]